jgi:hypothetical protein
VVKSVEKFDRSELKTTTVVEKQVDQNEPHQKVSK